MKYYAVSDVHGFYTETEAALREKGFFDSPDNVLILCGDALDRGREAKRMVEFLLGLQEEGRLVYVRGNHEDLMGQMLQQMSAGGTFDVLDGRLDHHFSNGTFNTALQLTGMDTSSALLYTQRFVNTMLRTPFWSKLLPNAVDYFEMGDYIFVHGYIPCSVKGIRYSETYSYRENWRNADGDEWMRARWFNGMEMAVKRGITEPGKTIVCGHCTPPTVTSWWARPPMISEETPISRPFIRRE